MMLIYKLSIRLFAILIRLLSPFHRKAALLRKGRKETLEKIADAFPDSNILVAWFHCASLGEFEQGRPLIEAFKTHFPRYKILLTFFSPSGYEIRKNYPLADCVAYLPSDTMLNAQNFISIARPKVAFFIKYEFWHYYFRCLKAHNIPIFSVSAIFRPQQLFFKSYGTFFRITLHCVSHFFVQNQRSKDLLASIGLQNTTLTGDTRFDRVKAIFDAKKSIPIAEQFKNNSPT
ncbi:MAG: 3-deoxy-D-manno-octulosonic acid transferase, partial [Flammeovirgaceae bacterium]|nr:3-deoxy-D-manno-octulosonic acid transferase [Flammeovirgaceae bacterium]MDW8288780.1 glycosyltransferase N-terminal domain-containing protein [Flammeovirgaceae bacterium]